MIIYGMNRWKSAKASASATSDGTGQVRTKGEGDDKPVVKKAPTEPLPEGNATSAAVALSSIIHGKGERDDGAIKKPPAQPPPADGGDAAIALSPLMRRKGEGADPGIKKGRLARGSQQLQAVRPAENPGADESREGPECGLPRRRKPRATRSLGRPSSTP